MSHRFILRTEIHRDFFSQDKKKKMIPQEVYKSGRCKKIQTATSRATSNFCLGIHPEALISKGREHCYFLSVALYAPL